MHKAILQTSNLSFGYSGSGNPILHHVSVQFQEKKITAILGANGAGKSSLLKLLDGQYKRYSGSIKLENVELRRVPRNELGRTIAYLPQLEEINQDLSLMDYVLLGRAPYVSIWASPGGDDVTIVKNIISSLGLQRYSNTKISHLSGGEWQRTRIARALSQQPRIFLLDEPTTFLDLKQRKVILSILKDLQASDITTIFATHDPEAAADIADNLLLMKDGRILSAGAIEHTFSEGLLSDTFDVPLQVTNLIKRNVKLR